MSVMSRAGYWDSILILIETCPVIAAINSLVSRSRKSYYLYGFVQSINAGGKDFFRKHWEYKRHDAPHTVYYYRHSYGTNLLMFAFFKLCLAFMEMKITLGKFYWFMS